jgi:hypothetical protein
MVFTGMRLGRRDEMKDISEFEKEWKEASYGGYTDFGISMNGSWEEGHKQDSHYLANHRIVKYEIISPEKVKLIGDDGKALTVSVYHISGVV